MEGSAGWQHLTQPSWQHFTQPIYSPLCFSAMLIKDHQREYDSKAIEFVKICAWKVLIYNARACGNRCQCAMERWLAVLLNSLLANSTVATEENMHGR